MPSRFVDLHLHTNQSDGSDPPERVIERAAELDFSAVAITDHDTLRGLQKARRAAVIHGIELLPGTEISAKFGKREIHILGLGVREDSEVLNKALERLERGRAERADAMIARLNDLGVPITRAGVDGHSGGGAVGRMHIAKEVLALGHVRTVQEAFDKYIKAGRPAYVHKTLIACAEAIEAVHEAGGLAFVAHPGVGNLYGSLHTLCKHPFDGIEVFHSSHGPEVTRKLSDFAADRGLLVSGGSDCHGAIKGETPLMGKVRLPIKHYLQIREALSARGRGA